MKANREMQVEPLGIVIDREGEGRGSMRSRRPFHIRRLNSYLRRLVVSISPCHDVGGHTIIDSTDGWPEF